VLRSYIAQKGWARSQGGEGIHGKGSGTCHVGHVCVKKERIAHADPELHDQIVIKRRAGELSVAPNTCLDFVEVIKVSLIKLS
jgi:hypothetical protein